MMITTPGAKVFTSNVSDDYFALCLMVDETIVYEIQTARYAILTAYSPQLIHYQNKLTLSDNECELLKKWMDEITTYGRYPAKHAKECLSALYSIFVCELMEIENKVDNHENFHSNPSEIFLNFLRQLPANYLRHHDLQFYADKLSVSTIYLSRIVKKYSQQTVKNHIDRLLMSEASRLLKQTDSPIVYIAERLHFANPQSFCKFFVKHTGLSPREFRYDNSIL